MYIHGVLCGALYPGYTEIDSKKEIIYIYLEDEVRVLFLALNARLMFYCLSPKQVSSKLGNAASPPHLTSHCRPPSPPNVTDVQFTSDCI